MSSKVEPPNSPMQQSGKRYCPGPIVLLLRLRAWRSHGLACPGISSPVSHRRVSPVSAPTEVAVMGELSPAGHRHPPSLPRAGPHENHPQLLGARAGAAPRCPSPRRGGDGKGWRGQPTRHVPTRGAHRASPAVRAAPAPPPAAGQPLDTPREYLL